MPSAKFIYLHETGEYFPSIDTTARELNDKDL